MIKKIIKWLFIILVCAIGYSAISIWSFSQENQLVKTDAAIVLGAAAWGKKPSPVFEERIKHAIWLYENGYVDKIIFTGGKRLETDLAEAEVGRLYSIERGVPESDIIIEANSLHTEENLELAYEIAQEYGLESFTLVSDPFHMKRAMTIAKYLGMEAYSSPTQTSAYVSLRTKLPFFIKEVFYYLGYLVSLVFR